MVFHVQIRVSLHFYHFFEIDNPQECIRMNKFPCTHPIVLFFSTNPHQVHVDGVIGAKSTCLEEVEREEWTAGRGEELLNSPLAKRLTPPKTNMEPENDGF